MNLSAVVPDFMCLNISVEAKIWLKSYHLWGLTRSFMSDISTRTRYISKKKFVGHGSVFISHLGLALFGFCLAPLIVLRSPLKCLTRVTTFWSKYVSVKKNCINPGFCSIFGLDFSKLFLVLKIFVPNFFCWVLRCKEPSCPYCLKLGLWMMLEVPDWGLGSSLGFYLVCLGPRNLYSEFRFSMLSLKVQRTLMSLLT